MMPDRISSNINVFSAPGAAFRRGIFPILGIAAFLLSFASTLPVFAHESVTSTNYKILRNDYDVSGSSVDSTNYRMLVAVDASSTSVAQSSNFRIFQGFVELAVHPNTITDLSGFESGPGVVTLNWTVPPVMDGFTTTHGSYTVKWASNQQLTSEALYDNSATAFNGYLSTVAPGGRDSRVITGLTAGTSIFLAIRPQDSAGNMAYISSGLASRTGIFISSAPTPPINFIAIARSTHEINWEWNSPADPSGNEMGYRVVAASGGAISNNLAINATYFIQSNLTAHVTFSAIVQAFNNHWISSNSFVGTTHYTLPQVPTNLSTLAIGSRTVTLGWNTLANPVDITSYTVRASTASDFSLVQSSSGTFLSTSVLNGLVGNTSYFFNATAYNPHNEGSVASASTFTFTLAAPPLKQSVVGGANQVSITWNANVNSPGTFYQVEISTHQDFSLIFASQLLTENTTTFTGLPSNTTTYVRARAINRDNIASDFADFGSDNGVALPVTASDFKVHRTSVTVTVNSSNPQGTTVYLSTTSGVFISTSVYPFAAGLSSAGVTSEVSANAAVLSIGSLTPNTSYSFYLFAVNNVGLPTEFRTVNAGTYTLSDVPQAGQVTSISTYTVNYNWTQAGLVANNPVGTTYYAQISTSSDFSTYSETSTWTLGVSSSNLFANTTYFIRLQSFNFNSLRSTYSIVTATSTWSAVPYSPVISPVYISSFVIALATPSGEGNPLYTEYAIYNVTDNTWLQTPNGGWESALGVNPVWRTYDNWRSTIGVVATGLTPNSRYRFAVKSRNSLGFESPTFSLEASSATLSHIPTLVNTPAIYITSAAVNWSGGANPLNQTSYTFLMSESSTDFSTGLTMSSTTLLQGATLYSLLPDATYYIMVKSINIDGVESASSTVISTVTLAHAPTIQTLMDIGPTTASFNWSFIGISTNPTYTRYLLEVSSDNFATIQGSVNTSYMGSLPISGTVVNLRSNTTYQAQVSAINQQGVRSTLPENSVTFVTDPLVPMTYLTGMTTATFHWDAQGVGLSKEFQAELSSISSDGPYLSTAAWTQGMTENLFIDLSTNTEYFVRVQFRDGSGQPAYFLQTGSTWTLAATPPTPSIVLSASKIIISTGSNPAGTQYAIQVNAVGSQFNNTFVPVPSTGNISNMLQAGFSPVWLDEVGWFATTSTGGVVVQNLPGGARYFLKVKARNGAGVETDYSGQVILDKSPTAPEIFLASGTEKSNLLRGSWVNALRISWMVENSVHYHCKFSMDQNEFAAYSKNSDISNVGVANNRDEVFFSTDNGNNNYIFYSTASTEGTWYMNCLGDSFGFPVEAPDALHLSLGKDPFQVKIDTTAPEIKNLAVQYSPTDNTPVYSSSVTFHRKPYFTWKVDHIVSEKESPVQQFEYSFTKEGVVHTSTGVQFSSVTYGSYYFPSSLSDTDSGTYTFTVRAQDRAGNWSSSATFTYVYFVDIATPSVSVIDSDVSQVPMESDGRFIGLQKKPTIYIQFGESMKSNTLTSTENVKMYLLRDNLGNYTTYSILIDLTLVYNDATKKLEITPAQDLRNGCLYRIVVSSNITDLGGNAVGTVTTVKFETVMNHNEYNRVIANDGRTVIEVPAGAFPEDASISVRGPASSELSAPGFTGRAALQAALQQSIQSANDKLTSIVGMQAQEITVREFNALNASNSKIAGGGNFNMPITVTIPFNVDAFGKISGTGANLKAGDLAIYVLDERNNMWQKINDFDVDLSTNAIRARVSHFSVYAILGVGSSDVSTSYAYPVPFRSALGHREVTFTLLPSQGKIRIYTATGEMVREIGFNNPLDGKITWDMKNTDSEDVASDVYLYIIESGDNKKFGKLMVIR